MSEDLQSAQVKNSETSAAVEIDDVDDDGMSFGRYLLLGGGGLIALILVIFAVGVGVAVFASTGPTAARLSMIRDVFIIVLALEFILIIIALVILILQITRLIVMLQNEVKPILRDTRETVDSAKGTAQFVGKNVARPVINAQGFLAGSMVFIREVGGIRRAIKRRESDTNQMSDEISTHE